MDFKDRFKGRTSTVTKEGVINNLNAPSTNPVQKSFSNNQLSARSKAPTPLSYNDNQPSLSYQRNSIEHTIENNKIGLTAPTMPPHSYSKSPVSRNTVSNNPSRLPTGSASVTPSKNPYFVANPFPSLDQMEKQYANYDHAAATYGRLEQQQQYPVQANVYQSLPNTQFNPNSFYNQHSQYKGNGPTEPTPKRENIERQANYGGFNPTQLAKKNFENLSQQHKLKRGEEPPNQIPNNRYGDYQNSPGPMPVYANTNFSYNPTPNMQMQMQMPMYNGQRDIHSNPSPHQQLYTSNPFGYYPPPHVSQFNREVPPPFHGSPVNRQPPSSSPDAGKKNSQIQSSTGYKPYNLQDYKDTKGKASVKLGGLGANTNTEEWYTQKEKREKMLEFSQNVKMFNMQRLPVTETGFKPRREKEKEKSRREVALEFAKNVPKPKHQQRRDSPSLRGEEEQPSQYLRAKRSESDMPTHYAAMEDLDTYEQRHNFYAAQLNKIKNDK